MKVFISWSGERSKSLANALHGWLPLVLHYVQPWLSEADIEAGQRWADHVTKELGASNYGIICITRENVLSPWVLFEAGALAKSLQETRVIPLLLDHEFKDISGPLAQFQAKKVERAGLLSIVESLNRACSAPAPDDRVDQLFNALWPDLEAKIAAVPKAAAPAKHARPQVEVLEELVTGIRSLDARFREVAEDGPRVGRRRRMRFHPMMIHELSHMLQDRPGDPLPILLIASMFREEVPWLYELGLEAYRAAQSGPPEVALATRRRFQRAAELLVKGPFPAEAIGLEPREMHFLTRELFHLLEREEEPVALPEAEKSPRRRREKSE